MQENKVNCNGRIKMARFGFRGGGSRNSRSSGKRHSSAGRRSGSWSSSSRKGSAAKNRNAHKSSQGGVVAYSIYDSREKRTYVGTTKGPERRAAQHAKSGKLAKGGKLVVKSKRLPRRIAETLEAKKIQGYRSRTGRLPKHNKTPDGQYHL